MIRRALARLLRVAPPGWFVTVVVLIFLLCEAPAWYATWKFGGFDVPNRFGPRILKTSALLLGVFRAMAFHPYYRPRYLEWLKATPWTVRLPLPLGPLELVPEDSLALGLLILLGIPLPDFTSLNIINLFLFGNIITLVATFWKTGASAHGYCAVLFLGFIPQMWQRQWVDFAILAAIYLVVHDGLWRSLQKFPWQGEGFWRDQGFANAPVGADPNPSCGWSFDRLYRDIRMAKGIDRGDAFLCSMLLCWWLFSACSLVEDSRDRGLAVVLLATTVITIAPMVRLYIYVRGYRSPLSFWGRIFTLRWIIPGYDRVFVGPICSLAAGILVAAIMSYQSIPIDVSFTVAAGAAVLLALVTPPRLKHWRLLGQHRLDATLSDKQVSTVHAGGRS